MAAAEMLSPDTHATALLTVAIGNDIAKPLSIAEYNGIATRLVAVQKRPADLLSSDGDDVLREVCSDDALDRVRRLVDRGGVFALALRRWASAGIWVLGRADAGYPSRYKRLLRHGAPPILFGIGERSALDGGGLAVVGSRDIDERFESAARAVGSAAAGAGVVIVSGAARGVDTAAMLGAAAATGRAVGVVADGLLKLSTRKEFREPIVGGQMTLISAFAPDARFTVARAMMRNKWIYALADRALVVTSSNGKGGTWAGAIEALKAGRNVYVWAEEPVPRGNRALIEQGARPIGDCDAALFAATDAVLANVADVQAGQLSLL